MIRPGQRQQTTSIQETAAGQIYFKFAAIVSVSCERESE